MYGCCIEGFCIEGFTVGLRPSNGLLVTCATRFTARGIQCKAEKAESPACNMGSKVAALAMW